ncbi:hypothetical protein L3V86_01885 [Thiotrichales bacterium 19S11-10]|nr:hypothetical protein [Thiotrichales bacterium 19S11-10]
MENYDFDNDSVKSNISTEPALDETSVDESEKARESLLQKVLSKNILFYGGIVVLGVVLFIIVNAILDPFGFDKPTKKPQSKPVAQQTFENISQPEIKTVKVAQQTMSSSVSNVQLNNKVAQIQEETKKALEQVAKNLKEESEYVFKGMQQLSKQQKVLADKQDQMVEIIKELSKRMQAVQKDVDMANSKVKNMANLQQTLTSISQQLSMLQAERTNMSDPLELSAVMPNRAWLQDTQGRTIAITVGSKLQGYGSVVKIDSENNKVYTSSGYVFE